MSKEEMIVELIQLAMVDLQQMAKASSDCSCCVHYEEESNCMNEDGEIACDNGEDRWEWRYRHKLYLCGIDLSLLLTKGMGSHG